jgi:probable rRNA maturation factor
MPRTSVKKQSVPFDLTVTASAGRAHVGRLRRMLPKARALVGGRVAELSVAIVGDRKMAELHESFMGIEGPTDVLTFELDHDARGRVTAGEVVVNAQEATRRAREHGVAVADELLLYAVHGLLHLSGYDDTTKMAYAKMHRKEDQILTRLGVGRVFSRGGEAEQPGARRQRRGRR